MDPLVSNYGGVPDHALESSPKSSTHQHADWDEPLPPVPGAKLRLMCSYGGHIIPRPHDKTLCYVGGETRIVVAERNSSLSDLIARLSHTLLDGRKFTLKYQLPNEDLDSLISVANDDDLENMIDEYDRIAANNGNAISTSRIRLFLFLAKPETAQTMGSLFNDAQSEDWFVEALNNADALSRGLSESAAVGDLLRLDSDPGMQLQTEFSDNGANQTKIAAHPQDVHSIQSIMSDSPMVENNTSSFDSSTSSPSMAHLPPIRVRADENNDANTRFGEEMKGGAASLEQQFTSQLRLIPPPSSTNNMAHANYAAVVATNAKIMHRNDSNISSATISDDDGLSEHGLHGPSPSRKPPLPLTVQQRATGGFNNLPSSNDLKNATSGGFNLPSPDSVKSDSSIASGVSLTKTTNHQDQAQVTTLNETKPPIIHQHSTELKSDNHIPSLQNQNIQLQPPQDPNKYMYPPQQQQQQQQHQHEQQHQHQFIQENMHYIQTHPHLPPSYRPVYATPQQMHPHQGDHQQQYPMYLLPINQAQPYNVAHQLVPNASMAAHAQPPVYPAGTTAAPANTQYQQYVGYNPNVQPITGNAVNYGHFDYGHNQVYYTGQLAAPPAAVPVAAPSQYQSLTPAQAAMIAEASMQLPNPEHTKQQPTS